MDNQTDKRMDNWMHNQRQCVFFKRKKNAKDEKFKKMRNEKLGVTSFFLSQKSEMA